MCPALSQSADSSLEYVGRRVEVGFANFQMNYFLALMLQGTRLVKNFKGSLGAESRHALSQSKLMLYGFSHRGKTRHYTGLRADRFPHGFRSRSALPRLRNRSVHHNGVYWWHGNHKTGPAQRDP